MTVPKLRFSEFWDVGEWEEKKLSAIAELTSSKRVHLSDYVPNGIPFFRGKEISLLKNNQIPENILYISEEHYEEIRETYGVPEIGDILITAVGTLGNVYCIKESNKFYFKDGNLIWMKNISEYSTFLEILLNVRNKYVLSSAIGSSQKALTMTELNKLRFAFPKIEEQKKIADCLSSIDDRITTETQKIDTLKAHKKGLMQQLFPAEGETLPKLRFPEFRDAGEWEVKRLEDIAPLQRGFDLPSDQIKPGNIPVVYSNGVQRFHSTGMAKAPGLVTGRSGTIGKIHFIEAGDYWPHNTSLWVTSFKGNFPKFIYYLYKSIGTARFASGSGVPTLNRNYVHAFHACLPPSVSEQKKIADCLSCIADRITAQTQKIDTLKTHKKGLMQQLFPAVDEVSG